MDPVIDIVLKSWFLNPDVCNRSQNGRSICEMRSRDECPERYTANLFQKWFAYHNKQKERWS